jgi:type II secretory pathway component PulC
MYESINEELLGRFFENPSVTAKREIYEEMVLNGEISSFAAASELVRIFEDSKQKQ